MDKIRTHVKRYPLAALAASAALALRRLLDPIPANQNPYHTVWLAIVFCAWYCGNGPSITAIAISVVGLWYWFLPPYHSFAGKNQSDFFGMLGFLVFSAVIVALGESSRRIFVQREETEERLRKVQGKLVDRVKKRTAALEQETGEMIEKDTLLDLANDAIFVKSANGTISYWNRGAERLYGWTMAEAISHILADGLASAYINYPGELKCQPKVPKATRAGFPQNAPCGRLSASFWSSSLSTSLHLCNRVIWTASYPSTAPACWGDGAPVAS